MAISYFHTTYAGGESVPLIKEFAHGCVIATGSRTTQIMSDVWDTEIYAMYWDEDSQSVKSQYLYLAYESGEWERKSNATVDATPEVWEKVRNYYYNRYLEKGVSAADREAQTIRKESIVKVTGGRQNKGAEGKVVVAIERPYGMGYRSVMMYKYGIATSDVMVDKMVNGRVYKNHRDIVWAWARNCELAVVPSYDIKPLEKLAMNSANRKVEEMQKSGTGYMNI